MAGLGAAQTGLRAATKGLGGWRDSGSRRRCRRGDARSQRQGGSRARSNVSTSPSAAPRARESLPAERVGWEWLGSGTAGPGGAAGAGSGRCRRRLIPSGPDSSGGYARAEGSCSLPDAKAVGQGVGNVAPPSPIRWERLRCREREAPGAPTVPFPPRPHALRWQNRALLSGWEWQGGGRSPGKHRDGWGGEGEREKR